MVVKESTKPSDTLHLWPTASMQLISKYEFGFNCIGCRFKEFNTRWNKGWSENLINSRWDGESTKAPSRISTPVYMFAPLGIWPIVMSFGIWNFSRILFISSLEGYPTFDFGQRLSLSIEVIWKQVDETKVEWERQLEKRMRTTRSV